MTVTLTHNSYGKSRVRLSHVTRQGERDQLKELDISVQLEGDFAASYISGDNRHVVATDSMKNTIYVLARTHGIRNIENFGRRSPSTLCRPIPRSPRRPLHWRKFPGNALRNIRMHLPAAAMKRTALVSLTRQSLRVESGVTEFVTPQDYRFRFCRLRS